MPAEKEVMKYVLDITDVEQKSRRLDELLDKQKKLASTGTADPALDAEIKALQGVAVESDKAAKGLGKVADQNKTVAAGARGMARSFGGLGGLFGDIVASILEGSKALAGFIAAGLGITAVISVFKKLKAELRELIDLEREHNKVVAEAQAMALGPQFAIDEIPKSKGGLTGSASEAAGITANRLGVQFGVSPDLAGVAGAFGTLGGLSFADTGILAAGNPSVAAGLGDLAPTF